MAIESRHHKFAADGDRSWVLDAIDELSEAGRGWINLQPAVHDDDDPEPHPSAGGMFSSRSGELPMATWTAPAAGRKGVDPATVGIQHGAGMRALPWLAELGIDRPAGWRVLADSPRRGLVLAVPDAADAADVLDWLLRATRHLCAIDVPPRWQAVCYQPG